MIFNFAILVSECLVPGMLGIGFRCFFPGASTMPPLRQQATSTLAAIQGTATGAGGFDAWLETELTRRRDERKVEALRTLVDRPLPNLPLTTVDGRPYDTKSLQGKKLLLNFFASW